jgi:hypothetical protein
VRTITLASLAALFCCFSVFAQAKPQLVVHPFTLAPGANWPYDMNQLVIQTITQLRVKDGEYFDVVTQASDAAPRIYHLDGEVLEWHAGNKATRVFVGVGTGRETAKIHYWLTDQRGERIFEHTDTIRQAFWGNAYAESVGQLAQPFADKIAERLREAKLVSKGSSVSIVEQTKPQTGTASISLERVCRLTCAIKGLSGERS